MVVNVGKKHRRLGLRILSVCLLFTLGFAACSSEEEEAASEGVLSPRQRLASVEGGDTGQFEELWQQYLETYDKSYADGSVDGDLADIAGQPVIDALEIEVTDNKVKVDDNALDGVQTIASSPELVLIEPGAEQVSMVDCTTHEVRLLLGEPFEIYTERQIDFEFDNDQWVIANVQVLRDGWFSDQFEFGCVPSEVADEALRVGQIFQNGAIKVERDPSQGLSDEMLAVASVDLTGPLEQGLAALSAQGYRSDSPVEASFEVEGLNYLFASQEGPVVRILACIVYPEGQVITDAESGEVVEELLGTGASRLSTMDVIVREGPKGEVVGIASSEGGC